ncbi:proteinase inhibitor I4 serpin, partial [Streptomyces nojiriensis]
MRNSTVRAVNRLTARWAAAAHTPDGNTGTVFTAAGLWPLLALLAGGSGGPGPPARAPGQDKTPEAAGRGAR